MRRSGAVRSRARGLLRPATGYRRSDSHAPVPRRRSRRRGTGTQVSFHVKPEPTLTFPTPNQLYDAVRAVYGRYLDTAYALRDRSVQDERRRLVLGDDS